MYITNTTVDKSAPLFCYDIGTYPDRVQCCHPSNQTDIPCQILYNRNTSILNGKYGCESGDCFADCIDPAKIFAANLLYSDLGEVDRDLPKPLRKFWICSSLPAMAGYALQQNVLVPNIQSTVSGFLPPDESKRDLFGVTSAMTECLAATCRNSRNSDSCRKSCTIGHILTNNTTPNAVEINRCMYDLCRGGIKSMPYADSDIIGIGVSKPLKAYATPLILG
jgi:hypothetical protein